MMLLIMKSFISLFIFITMFFSAWWVDSSSKRTAHLNSIGKEQTIGTNDVKEITNHNNILLIEPFKPREYIKIYKNI